MPETHLPSVFPPDFLVLCKSSHTTCLSGDMTPVRVSGQVASSYTKGFPALHGTKVMQSGHLPSDLEKPGGFNLEGTLAADSGVDDLI